MFPQYTIVDIKDNSFRKNGDYINMRDMITVAGTQKTHVFHPSWIVFSRCVVCKLQSSENT